MLSCSCPEWDGDPGTWAFYPPEDFITFSKKRRKRCSSCQELINSGSLCLEFERIRGPYTDIEERISGEEITMPSLFMCEKCGEQYLNLSAIGYCPGPTDNQLDLLKEYQEMTGFVSADNS